MAIEFKFKTLAKWPRESTPDGERKSRPFMVPAKGEGESFRKAAPVPVARTYDELRKELTHLGVDGPVIIQVALAPTHIRVDGLLRADAPRPKHPGVVLSFEQVVGGRRAPMSFAVDACDRWEDNLRGIVLTLERLRLVDLYGATRSGEQYRGWAALPPGGLVTAAEMTPEGAAALVLAAAGPLVRGISDKKLRARAETAAAENLLADRELFKSLYHLAASEFHPDNNGGKEHPQWKQLHDAKAVIEKHQAGKAGG